MTLYFKLNQLTKEKWNPVKYWKRKFENEINLSQLMMENLEEKSWENPIIIKRI